jgi:pantoate--beta-alanine ligase
MPLSIKVVETAREADGLAMSSRNVYLSPEDRAVAPLVYKALTRAHHEYTEMGERRVHVLKNIVHADLMSNPNISVDYVSLANGNTAEELSDDTLCPNSTLLSVAVTIGETRLIDNIILNQ